MRRNIRAFHACLESIAIIGQIIYQLRSYDHLCRYPSDTRQKCREIRLQADRWGYSSGASVVLSSRRHRRLPVDTVSPHQEAVKIFALPTIRENRLLKSGHGQFRCLDIPVSVARPASRAASKTENPGAKGATPQIRGWRTVEWMKANHCQARVAARPHSTLCVIADYYPHISGCGVTRLAPLGGFYACSPVHSRTPLHSMTSFDA